uniref:Uncharacterized protein n=1 Tax=viral metagenome TaxID=1070528 RepID=A0A6C0BP04_9ZZZZ
MGRVFAFVSGLAAGKFVTSNMESREVKSGLHRLGNVNVEYSVMVPTGWKAEADYRERSTVKWKV